MTHAKIKNNGLMAPWEVFPRVLELDSVARSQTSNLHQVEAEAEWWEQFGDCYEYWEPIPESEFDYLYWGLVRKK